MMKTLNVIGAGRLGKTLARRAVDSGCYRIGGVCNRDLVSSRAAVAFIGEGVACARVAALPPADLWLLAVPDAAIATVARALAAETGIAEGAVAFHASGACEAVELEALMRRGVRCASLHPVFSFADAARAVATFAGAQCAIEGDAEACAELERLARAMGAEPFRLAPGGKAAYHAALCVASNYLVTLTALAQHLAGTAGIAHPLPLLGGLMRQTLENVLNLGPAAALTGPIARGDAETVRRHLAVLPTASARATYLALGRATLELARPGLVESAVAPLARLLADD